VENDLVRHKFYHKGNKVGVSVYDEAQFAFLGHMPEPKKIDSAKIVISPMPG